MAAETQPGVGHNSGANAQLKAIVERIERLEVEKAGIRDDQAAIYAEAKAVGFDTRIIRAVIRRRRKDAAKLAEEEALTETYLHALGMI